PDLTTRTTDARGVAIFSDIETPATIIAQATAPGFSGNGVRVDLANGDLVSRTLALSPVGWTVTVTPSDTSNFSGKNPVFFNQGDDIQYIDSVSISSGFFADSTGAPVTTGTILVEVTGVDPNSERISTAPLPFFGVVPLLLKPLAAATPPQPFRALVLAE